MVKMSLVQRENLRGQVRYVGAYCGGGRYFAVPEVPVEVKYRATAWPEIVVEVGLRGRYRHR